jgi:hypothetical protein
MSFDDIAGNEYAKEIINETFVLPNIMPHLFRGKARPWQSLLIYGVSHPSSHLCQHSSLLELEKLC